MLVTLSTHQGDAASAIALLKWIAQLGTCSEHNLCIVADANVQWSTGLELIALGNKAFKNTGFIHTKESVQGWPKGSNALWKLAAQHCKDHHTDFLWLEPDAIPLRKGWLDELQKAWNARTKTFLGRIYAVNDTGLPTRMMSGIGIYPHNAIDLLAGCADTDKAWDVVAAERIVPAAEHTRLIHHFWGQPNLSPTFAAMRTQHSPINTFTLDMVDPEAILFHRTKDDNLIRILRKKLFPEIIEATPRKFDVVYPFCATDADLALANMQWMAELQESYNHTIILAIDEQSRLVNEILHVAKYAFEQCIIFKYALPPVAGHPQAANWAFRHTARYMQERGNPWFWMEADLIPLKEGWLDKLQDEYSACGADCMGSVIHELGHLNGTAVYPANLASTAPVLMNTPEGHWAFDTVITPDISGRMHDAGHLMFHVWCMQGDILLPYGSGTLPTFPNRNSMRYIPPEAYTLHRCKDSSLINRLREQKIAR